MGPLGAAAALLTLAGAAFGVGYEWRSVDGRDNNLNPGCQDWGGAGTGLLRFADAAYGANGADPSGADRPNPRAVSNAVFAQSTSTLDRRGLTDMVWQWGQFLDHDISFSPSDSGESFHIAVTDPADPLFPVIPMNRSGFDPSTGTDGLNPRVQTNRLTSWIDASNVYGSGTDRADWLRHPDPSRRGQLNFTPDAGGALLPYNDGTQEMDNGTGFGGQLFVAGDNRANEQVGLVSMHTLFMREHNRWAEAFAASDAGLSSDEVYERARRVVGAQMQAITYNEFLPALLGDAASNAYDAGSGYDDTVDASVRNEFATAFFRLGHSMLSPEIQRLGEDGLSLPGGALSLDDAFFRPDVVADEGVDPFLRGLAGQRMQKIDAQVIDGVRNRLFGAPGSGGLDLASLNIQRGRDHGLPDYNTIRAALGLDTASSFDHITSDTALAQSLRDVYGQTGGVDNVHLLDVWVGALAEDHLPGSSVGELLAVGLDEQFEMLRAGDRFYYEHDADLALILAEIGLTVADLESRLLSDIIVDNTGIDSLRSNVFVIPTPGSGALAAAGLVLGLVRRKRA